MTARLPTVGGDSGNWGTVLNQFLQTEHNSDGTIKNMLRVINVKDYGATGDGSTDDTTAIQNAINASSFGNTIFFPTGTYIVSTTIKLLKGRRYIGSNRESTTIKQANGANLDAVLASETWLSTNGTPETQGDNPIYI